MNAQEALTTARWHLMNGRQLPWGDEVNAAVLQLISDKLGYASPGMQAFPIAKMPPKDAAPLIALCLGHARPVDEGNVSAGGVSEEDFNRPLIRALAAELRRRGVRTVIRDFYPPAGYEAAMTWLAHDLRSAGVTAAIEFHFNAANKTAAGHEVLHWEHSVRGVTLARSLVNALAMAFPGHPHRGLKPRSYQDRGALFLSLTHCPAAIVEPFFGDNPREWEFFSGDEAVAKLVTAYADGIEDWIEGLEVAA